MSELVLTRFTCKDCKEDFYMEIVGKSLEEVGKTLMNIHCPLCREQTNIDMHAQSYHAIPRNI